MNRPDEWKRLIVALNDLAESEEHIEAHVAFSNTPEYSEAYGALGMDMARRMEYALLSYALIAYARPFVQSRGGGWTKLPGRFTSGYTKEERRVHNYVLQARRKLIAHSDLDGIHAELAKTESGKVIMSARPVPIVMIPGEDDSLSIDLAAERTATKVTTTLEQFRQIVDDMPPGDQPSSVFLRESRQFDVDISVCNILADMIGKVNDAISKELGLT